MANVSAEPVPGATLRKRYVAAKAAALNKLDEGRVLFSSAGATGADHIVHQQRGHVCDAADVRCRFKETLKLECVVVLSKYVRRFAVLHPSIATVVWSE